MIWTIDDTWIAVTGTLVAVSCALLGNFLLLRRLSMMGDAISHTVLPGLVGAFLLTGTRDVLPMFIGALVIGILSALLIQTLTRYSQLDEGSAMGVVFTSLFALGLLMIERAASRVHLDPDCVLFGAIEQTPLDARLLMGVEVPLAAIVNALVLMVNALVVAILYKEWKVSSFDPTYSNSQGISSGMLHYILMALVATTCVAAFESVGSILVIAMLVVPAATAHLPTHRLSHMIMISLVVAIAAAWGGHWAAVAVPAWYGLPSTSTAGMMAVIGGVIFLVVLIVAPRHGLGGRLVAQALAGLRFSRIDALGHLFRATERGMAGERPADLLHKTNFSGWLPLALRLMNLRGEIYTRGGIVSLTPLGIDRARRLVRTHRLWEHYLSESAGMPSSKVHGAAELIGYHTSGDLQGRLEERAGHVERDPHDKVIPPG